MPKTITLLASGTRGDVQPYLALALGLRAAGYRLRFATHRQFAAQVEQWALPYVPLADNPSDLFTRSGNEEALQLRGHPLRTVRATLRYWRATRPVYERLVLSAWPACQGADALIIGLPTLWGAHLAEALGIPAIRGLLQPLTPTGEFPCPLLPFTASPGAAFNRWSYRCVESMIDFAWRGAINRWRRAALRPTSAVPRHKRAATLTLYGLSDRIVPRPGDWPASHLMTGYWFLPNAPDWRPPDDLVKFLAAGDPPSYIGLGSSALRHSIKLFDLLIGALQDAGLRAILLQADRPATTLPTSQLYPVADIPHAWLFPQVRAVIHHGGAGTTGAALRAGVPMLILPVSTDHFFWGARVAALGVGPQPMPVRRLTRRSLADALTQLTEDAVRRTRAQQLAEAINREDGVARAVRLIQAWL